jgi:hypothetical protein
MAAATRATGAVTGRCNSGWEGQVSYWIALAVVILAAAVVIARGAIEWHLGAMLLVVALVAVAAVEALVRGGVLAPGDSGGALAAIAVSVVLLWALLRRRSRGKRAGPQ